MINFGTNILLLSSGNQFIFVKTHAETHMHIYSYTISMYLTHYKRNYRNILTYEIISNITFSSKHIKKYFIGMLIFNTITKKKTGKKLIFTTECFPRLKLISKHYFCRRQCMTAFFENAMRLNLQWNNSVIIYVHYVRFYFII